MSEWQKVENPVGNGATPAAGGQTAPEEAAGRERAVLPDGEYPPVPPHRPRKRRSDAGKKRTHPEEGPAASTASAGPADACPAPEGAEQAGADSPPAGAAVPGPDEKGEAVLPQPAVAARKRSGGWSSPAVEVSERPASAGTGAAAFSPVRYTRAGQRRGQRRWAAPLGLLILLLAAVGVVALVVTGIRAIRNAQDDTALKEELYDFLLPVMQQMPGAFESPDDTEQDALILAAIWRVTNAERIRQLQEKDSVSRYSIDDNGRMLVPLEEINESYAYLFGEEATPKHHSIGEEGTSFAFDYDPEEDCYHVPIISSSSIYIPVVDTLKKKGDTIEVRVGYVPSSKIGVDDKGEEIPPTPDDAAIFQVYTVQRADEDGWKLLSVEDEGSSAATTSTAAVTTSGTASTGSTGTTTTAAAATTTAA